MHDKNVSFVTSVTELSSQQWFVDVTGATPRRRQYSPIYGGDIFLWLAGRVKRSLGSKFYVSDAHNSCNWQKNKFSLQSSAKTAKEHQCVVYTVTINRNVTLNVMTNASISSLPYPKSLLLPKCAVRGCSAMFSGARRKVKCGYHAGTATEMLLACSPERNAHTMACKLAENGCIGEQLRILVYSNAWTCAKLFSAVATAKTAWPNLLLVPLPRLQAKQPQCFTQNKRLRHTLCNAAQDSWALYCVFLPPCISKERENTAVSALPVADGTFQSCGKLKFLARHCRRNQQNITLISNNAVGAAQYSTAFYPAPDATSEQDFILMDTKGKQQVCLDWEIKSLEKTIRSLLKVRTQFGWAEKLHKSKKCVIITL